MKKDPGVDKGKHHGVDHEIFQTGTHGRKADEQKVDQIKIVGTVTRLREEKGNEYLIRALPMVLRQGADFILLIVGDGPLRRELERLANELGIENHVRFLGFRSDVPELLSLFEIQVIPSLTEGFPLSLAEAMAAENAIVATEVGGMKEIGSDGDTVLFVPPKEPEALAEKILYLLKDKELANNMAKNAAHYSEVFSIKNSMKLLENEYGALCRSVQ